MSLIETIRGLQDGLSGDTVSKSRVVDDLLDLRLDAVEHPGVVALIDQVLADVPGKTIVLTSWVDDQLDALLLEVERANTPA